MSRNIDLTQPETAIFRDCSSIGKFYYSSKIELLQYTFVKQCNMVLEFSDISKHVYITASNQKSLKRVLV